MATSPLKIRIVAMHYDGRLVPMQPAGECGHNTRNKCTDCGSLLCGVCPPCYGAYQVNMRDLPGANDE